MPSRSVKANALQIGDVLFYTLEVIVHIFRDGLTPEGKISVALQKGHKARSVCYKQSRRIKLYVEGTQSRAAASRDRDRGAMISPQSGRRIRA